MPEPQAEPSHRRPADAPATRRALETLQPQRSAAAPASGPRAAPTVGRAIGWQRTAGNRAVAQLLAAAPLQRVMVTEGTKTETLYNSNNATTSQASAGKFTMSPQYELTRNGDAGVTVTVRIKFLNQDRNGIDPTSPTAPPNTPPLGQLTGKATEIPVNDPDDRRTWATQMSKDAVAIWNGHLTFLGEERNLLSANTQKRLPVTFQAVPVFGLNDTADAQIIVHPKSVVAGTPGQPIDAGNYYVNKGNYSADDKVIAAHEYGHLIGIPDEYSQSNEQLNALLHQAAPSGAASSLAALDRTTVERMVLSSMKQPLLDQLTAALPTVLDALRGQRALVKTRMAAAAKAGVIGAAVRDELRSQLTAAADPSLAASVPATVAFESTTNFSNRDNAATGVDAGFSAPALTKQLRDAYWAALLGAQGAVAAVAGLGDVRIDVQGSVNATTAGTGPQVGAATGLASSTVGPAAGAGPGLPAIVPSDGLVAALSALPTTWSGAGSALQAGVTPDLFATKMQAILKGAAAAATATAAALPPGTPAAPKLNRSAGLYRQAYALVRNSAIEASKQLSTDLVGQVIGPTLATSVANLQSSIDTEVNRVMTTPPAGVAALGPGDPNMVAMVAAMKARLDADKAATANTGRDPLGAGKAAPGQDVTYSYEGLMGSSATKALRSDQFNPMLDQFNRSLTTLFEKKFTAEAK